MAASKKTEEQVPDGSVQIESFHHLEGFDPEYGVPEISTWRDLTPEALKEAEKAERAESRAHTTKKES